MVNSPLIRPYLLGGIALGGVPLDSHEDRKWKPDLGMATSTYKTEQKTAAKSPSFGFF